MEEHVFMSTGEQNGNEYHVLDNGMNLSLPSPITGSMHSAKGLLASQERHSY
jgi:hypothetical protein